MFWRLSRAKHGRAVFSKLQPNKVSYLLCFWKLSQTKYRLWGNFEGAAEQSMVCTVSLKAQLSKAWYLLVQTNKVSPSRYFWRLRRAKYAIYCVFEDLAEQSIVFTVFTGSVKQALRSHCYFWRLGRAKYGIYNVCKGLAAQIMLFSYFLKA